MSTSAPTEGQESPLDPDEPHTPVWFSFLGLGLFLLGGIFLLVTADDEQEAPGSAAAPAATAAEEEAEEGDSPTEPEADPHAGHGHD